MKQVNLIKIGSDSVCDDNIKKLLGDIVEHENRTGEKSIIISSGSMKLGKEAVENSNDFIPSALCSIGQLDLVSKYQVFSLSLGRRAAQILLDDRANYEYVNTITSRFLKNEVIKKISKATVNIINHKKDKHMLATINNLLDNNAFPILNHNDSTSDEELNQLSKKKDNDKNTVHISEVVKQYGEEVGFGIKRVIYLTRTNGILDQYGDTLPGSKVAAHERDRIKREYHKYINGKSDNGTGGMGSKLDCALDVLKFGVKRSIISHASRGLECLPLTDSKSTSFQGV